MSVVFQRVNRYAPDHSLNVTAEADWEVRSSPSRGAIYNSSTYDPIVRFGRAFGWYKLPGITGQ